MRPPHHFGAVARKACLCLSDGNMQQQVSQSELVTPSQRLQAVPVHCAKHSDRFGWNGFRVEDYPDLPESDFHCPAMDHHLLVYHYKALDGEFIHECAGRKTVTRLRSGQVSFIPAGADNHWTFGNGKPSALHILVDTDRFDEITVTGGLDLRDDFQITSPEFQNISRRLFRELEINGASGVLFAETVMEMFCDALLRHFGPENHPRDTRLSNVTLARDLIESEFERTIHLAELASLCGLSQSQLLRSFKSQFGTSPHQFLLARRIREAKNRLLADEDEPLSQMSAELGFADQSHFTRHFSRATGVTPNQFRSRK